MFKLNKILNFMEKYYSSTVLCKFFETLYRNGVCFRCILRVFRQENVNLFRDKESYLEILCKVGEKLGDTQILLNEYDFLKYCRKITTQSLTNEGEVEKKELRIPASMRDQIITNATTLFQPEETDCIICLGILQKLENKEFHNAIMEKLAADDYEFESFKITVRCSLGVYVRQLCTTYQAQQELRKWCNQESISISQEEEGHLSYFSLLSIPIDIKAAVKWMMSGHFCDLLGKRSDPNDDRFQISLVFENLQDDFAQFGIFQETVRKMVADDWDDKIQKKLKVNNQIYKEQIEQKIEQKKHHQVEAFVPSQSNLERIAKIQHQFVTDQLMVESLINYQQGKYPMRNSYPVKVEVKSAYQNIFIKGNYIKYARFISQTPWFINDQKIYEDSIQDIIAKPCLSIFKPSEAEVHSCFINQGEDIDVRMLGDGRPFVIEMVDPHRGQSFSTQEILDKIQTEINKGTQVNVKNIGFTDTTCFQDLKNSETNKVYNFSYQKIKAYCCIVQTSVNLLQEQYDKLNAVYNLEIIQKTPIRVLHRRTLLERKKIIHKLKVRRINEQFMILFVLASAGTYIKEFIHGDLERTRPSLCELLNTECDIYQLDVMKLYVQCDAQSLEDFNKLE